ncbi:NADPH:quinone reductase [Phyllobacterium sp. CL33Tsu]|uniref:zinc-dependent alcohol dehydrogenase family protein n=1 Tax=Phyllobacterium sp. CL33Tsu TaxID=1798191 RepID=UPI0008EAD143|nr:zinc-dependent alcohol dehydrogenase family protein [Phyllobacterium sp. CL33Tsu]SFI56605.1 NADPH:quinone reductase [Phyllobacterium sp. CL33Tsu]
MGRVVRFYQYGGPDVLVIEDQPDKSPGSGEVRIRVKALGLNRAEALLRAGTYIETPTLPSGLGLEASGIVDAVGPAVVRLRPGDAVSVIPPISMVRWPAYGDTAIFPETMVIEHPVSLGFETAAALWMAFLTAYGGLIELAALAEGDVVAITAASSSVGLAAIQIARMVGAIPIAVTRTSAKRQLLRDEGAACVIASEEEDLEGRLKEMAGERGVRVVFDAVGGPIFSPLTAAMARGGVLIEYGGLSREPTPFPLAQVLGKCLTLRGYLVHEITDDPSRLEKAKAFILRGIADGILKPVIDHVFPFEDIVAAHRYLESNQQFGKIIVTI